MPSRWREMRWIEALWSSDQCGKVDWMAGQGVGVPSGEFKACITKIRGTYERRLLGLIGAGDTWIGVVKRLVVINFINHFSLLNF